MIVQSANKNQDIIGTVSMAYMQLFGITALAWMWTRIAVTSIAALEMGTEESYFHQAKLNMVKFFMSD